MSDSDLSVDNVFNSQSNANEAEQEESSDSELTEDLQTQDEPQNNEEIFKCEASLIDYSYKRVKIATTTCIYKYAIDRIRGAEDETIPWTPIMIIIIDILHKSYPLQELITEKNLAVLELLLDVPIQLTLIYNSQTSNPIEVKLEEEGVMDFSGQAFVEPKIILEWLLEKEIINHDDLRNASPSKNRQTFSP